MQKHCSHSLRNWQPNVHVLGIGTIIITDNLSDGYFDEYINSHSICINCPFP